MDATNIVLFFCICAVLIELCLIAALLKVLDIIEILTERVERQERRWKS